MCIASTLSASRSGGVELYVNACVKLYQVYTHQTLRKQPTPTALFFFRSFLLVLRIRIDDVYRDVVLLWCCIQAWVRMRLIIAVVLVAAIAAAAVDATKLSGSHTIRRMRQARAAAAAAAAATPPTVAKKAKTSAPAPVAAAPAASPSAASPVPAGGFKPADKKTLDSIAAPKLAELGKLPSALPTSIPIVANSANGNVGPTAANQLLVKRFATVKGVSIKEAEYQRHFENFMRKHKRVYKQEDLANRYALYKQHWNYVDNFNKMKPERATFTLATNNFMDHSNTEFKKRMGFKSARTHAPASVMQKNAKISTYWQCTAACFRLDVY